MLLPEHVWLWAGLTGYAASTVTAWRQLLQRQPLNYLVLAPLMLGVVLLAMAITSRWHEVGSGPFLTMYEILLSNLFSLGLIYGICMWLVPQAGCHCRAAAVYAACILDHISAFRPRQSSGYL